MNDKLQLWSDDIIYKHALTFSHEELAGMYALCNKREQDYIKEIKALRLILQSHGDIVEENARLREALEEIEKFQVLTTQDITLPMEIAREALERGEQPPIK